MVQSIKNWLIVILSIVIIIVSLDTCNNVDTVKTSPITKIIETRHDTVVKLDTLLKTKIKYIDTSKTTVVHETLNVMIPPVGPETTCIADNQLRECVKCKDSLATYKDIVKYDSIVLDSVSKIKPIKENDIWMRMKDIGTGMLIGAGIRSFF